MRALTHRHRRDRGFSFIELLAYMAIAALLILAAIPQFNNYRGNARDAATMNDVKNVSIALEAWAISNPGGSFPAITRSFKTEVDVGDLAALGIKLSEGTHLWAVDRVLYATPASTVYTTTGQAFCVMAANPNGRKYNNDSGPRFAYHSGNGGMGVECATK